MAPPSIGAEFNAFVPSTVGPSLGTRFYVEFGPAGKRGIYILTPVSRRVHPLACTLISLSQAVFSNWRLFVCRDCEHAAPGLDPKLLCYRGADQPREGDFVDDTSVVAIYPSHQQAAAAISQLQHSGFDVTKISIIGKDYHTEENVTGYYNTGDRMRYWGKAGAFWGGLWGLLLGAGFFAVPGVGPVLVAGPFLGFILSGLEGAALFGGLSAIGAGLYGIGIPKDSVLRYELALKSDNFLLIVHGSAEDAKKARELLQTTGTTEVQTHEVAAMAH